MKRIFATAAALVILAGTGTAFAQPGHNDHHDNHGPSMGDHGMMHGPNHANWRQGGRIERNDWNRGQHVDYRAHHLRRPPRGYEWRDGPDRLDPARQPVIRLQRWRSASAGRHFCAPHAAWARRIQAKARPSMAASPSAMIPMPISA